ncbi:MAG: IS1634 family transposase [Bacteroidales bacterium]|nr:IS1634 family transposase [Bacteroidales bacterium]
MRLKVTNSKNSKSFYIIKDYTKNKKRSTKVVHTIGNLKQVKELAGSENYEPWLKNYVENYKQKHKEKKEEVIIKKNSGKLITKNKQVSFDIGHVFLKEIYQGLKLNEICNKVSSRYKFESNLDDILSNLIYGRIIHPASKLKTHKISKNFIQAPNIKLPNMYRGLTYLNKEMDYIQETLYENSLSLIERDSRVIYFDCTNFYFEITAEDDLRKYGINKQHQPKPQVGMGLFMDGNGIPLAINIYPGNASETKQLIPTQTKIIDNFKLPDTRLVTCTDAAMCTDEIKKFNIKDGRGFVITQSLKKLKQSYLDEVFIDKDWRIPGDLKNTYNINGIQNNEVLTKKYYETIFYKIIPTETASVKQDLIVTFSLKYRDYRKSIRDDQIKRANKKITNNSNGDKIKLNTNPNDYRRFIQEKAISKDNKTIDAYEYSVDYKKIEDEEKYDGYYGITTNLNDDIKTILSITRGRWEIEESFRIMKHDFKTGTVELTREDRITAHFLTCFISLLIYRILEKKLNYKYTTTQILDTLRTMKVTECKGDGYIPAYERTDITDDLHDFLGFRTDYEILTYKYIEKLFDIISKK